MSLARELLPGNTAPRESLSTQTLDQLIGWLKDGTFKAGGNSLHKTNWSSTSGLAAPGFAKLYR